MEKRWGRGAHAISDGDQHILVSGLRCEHYMLEAGEFGPNSRSSTFVCIILGKCARHVLCADRGKPRKTGNAGPLPWCPNSRQPLDNEPWTQQVWCDTGSHFRGNTQLTHRLLSVPRGARDYTEILSEELVPHDSDATRQIGVRTSKEMCACAAVPGRPSSFWAHQWHCN